MNPEQQRIAIAKACGWEVDAERKTYGFQPLTDGCRIYTELPDFLHDLNAMHDAEKVLWDTGKAMEFTNRLVGIVCLARGFRWDKGTEDDHLMCLSHATATQRAEAFLRTIGKWEEAK